MSNGIELDGIGTFLLDERMGWLVGERPFDITPLGVTGVFVLDDPDVDLGLASAAIRRFIALSPADLAVATPHVHAYYRDSVGAGWSPDLALSSPDDVWRHVTPPPEFVVRVSDGVAYVQLECECAWEPEHGLDLVFRDGDTISKVGQFDGHLHHLDRDVVYPGSP